MLKTLEYSGVHLAKILNRCGYMLNKPEKKQRAAISEAVVSDHTASLIKIASKKIHKKLPTAVQQGLINLSLEKKLYHLAAAFLDTKSKISDKKSVEEQRCAVLKQLIKTKQNSLIKKCLKDKTPFISDCYGRTGLYFARKHKHEEAAKLLQKLHISEDFTFSLSDENWDILLYSFTGTKFLPKFDPESCPGSYPTIMYPPLIKLWQEFAASTQQNPFFKKQHLPKFLALAEEITEAFTLNIYPENNEKLLQQILENKLVIIESGWSTHSVTVVFWKNYLFICDKDFHHRDAAFLEAFMYDKKRLLKPFATRTIAIATLEAPSFMTRSLNSWP